MGGRVWEGGSGKEGMGGRVWEGGSGKEGMGGSVGGESRRGMREGYTCTWCSKYYYDYTYLLIVLCVTSDSREVHPLQVQGAQLC